MPTCGSCGRTYYNFSGPHKCPGVVPMAGPNPWGTPWSASPNSKGFVPDANKVRVLYTQPFRQRTGSLTEPPEAA